MTPTQVSITYLIICLICLFLYLRVLFKQEGEITLNDLILSSFCILCPLINIVFFLHLLNEGAFENIVIFKRKNKEEL